MKLTKPLILISTLLTLSSQAYATDSAETLFNAKCSACHSTTRPTDMDKVIAPALMGVMRHLKMSYPDKTKAVAFIKDFTLNPTKEKSICMPRKIERFGLMPSQKGNVTEAELELIASWMFDNFPPKDFKGMHHGKRKGKAQKQKPKIKTLVEKIKILTETNTEVEKIIPLVQEVATLKAHATEVHLLCLAKTKAILTAKQLMFLSKQ